MKKRLAIGLGIGLISFVLTAGEALSAQAKTYHIVDRIPSRAANGLWDYATVDPHSGRLYLAQSGVTVLDLRTRVVTAHFAQGIDAHAIVHSVIPIADGELIAISDSATNSIKLFSAQSGAAAGEVRIGTPAKPDQWHNPDEIFFEPSSGYLISVNGDSGSLSLVDLRTRSVAGEIAIGGKLESAAADGEGSVYVNEEEKNAVAFVDIPHRRVVKEVALANCEEPTGLAYDRADHLIVSVCSNGLAKFVSTETGREVASLPVGRGADCALYDEERHVAFFPSGEQGTLTIVAVRNKTDISVIQTLATRPGSRLGALDPRSGTIYLPAAKFGPPAPPLRLSGLGELPGVNPGTFEFLVIRPKT